MLYMVNFFYKTFVEYILLHVIHGLSSTVVTAKKAATRAHRPVVCAQRVSNRDLLTIFSRGSLHSTAGSLRRTS